MKLVPVTACLAMTATAMLIGAPEASATPIGRNCSFTSVTDPTVENGETQTGQINGGPITDDTQPTASIYLLCTIQVGAANSTHVGADAVLLQAWGTGVAVVAGQASYVSPEGQPVYLCTEVWVADPSGHTTLFLNSVDGTWSTSNSVPCGEAISQEILPGPFAPVIDAVNQVLVDVVDPVICPILAGQFPPEGDIPEVGYDCPPYGG